MGEHSRGKHRLIKNRNIRARVGASTAIVALGLTGALAAAPVATAEPMAFTTTLAAPAPHNNDHHDGDAHRRDGDRFRNTIHFRAPQRRGHWDNACGPRKIFNPHLRRFVFVPHTNVCSRIWRNW